VLCGAATIGGGLEPVTPLNTAVGL